MKGRDRFKDLHMDGRIILKRMLKKQTGGCKEDSSG
jgi:hypothetical protein